MKTALPHRTHTELTHGSTEIHTLIVSYFFVVREPECNTLTPHIVQQFTTKMCCTDGSPVLGHVYPDGEHSLCSGEWRVCRAGALDIAMLTASFPVARRPYGPMAVTPTSYHRETYKARPWTNQDKDFRF